MEQKNEGAPTGRTLTFGERAVGITFNPGKLEKVEAIKRKCADAIDELNDQREATQDGEEKAQYTLAIRAIMGGQMWGVKAATWNLGK